MNTYPPPPPLPIRAQLQQQQFDLQRKLEATQAALDALDAHPGVEQVMDALQAALPSS